ncbi:MAG: hypothetical protein DRN37_07590 [Thermoplasmata archaeon]|nr:MAG: hypothetical protein DRN37_07590 [Thermoplasmata archaeon]HHD15719.1 hypothetical protein [Euryarchaeota archaeon]
MNRWIKGILLGVGIFFLLLSAIFFLGGISPDIRPDILAGAGILFLFGLIPLGIVTYIMKREASRPVNVSQSIHIDGRDLVGGERKLREMECRSCGAVLSPGDIRITDIGIAVRCPYCGSVYIMEEAPKW